MQYHIVKASRLYLGYGYSGPACELAGVEPGKTYEDKDEAQKDVDKLERVNPVGFKIVPVLVAT